MLQYFKIGQITNTHGVKGELKVFPLTDNIKRYSKLSYIYMKSGDNYEKHEIEGVKYLKNFVVLKLSSINDMDKAATFKNQYIYIDRENSVKLPKDTYFIADLMGMDVYTEEEEWLGIIVSVFATGSNDVYEIKGSSEKTVLIPAIKDVVKMVDMENRKIIVRLLEGLI